MANLNEILTYFPRRIANSINKKLQQIANSEARGMIEEIRIRTQKPIILKFTNEEYVLEDTLASSEEVLETVQTICDNSIYSYQNQICSGYITLRGGHRVGITGSVVLVDGRITNINYISSLNFRIAKQIVGASNRLLKYILNVEENTVFNTLIISPPGARKNHNIKRLNKKIKFRNGTD